LLNFPFPIAYKYIERLNYSKKNNYLSDAQKLHRAIFAINSTHPDHREQHKGNTVNGLTPFNHKVLLLG